MLAQVLKEQAAIGAAMVKQAVSKYSASGETAESVHGESTDNTLQIFAREFIETMQTGRGPRQSSKDAGFKDNLERWLKIKGFPQKRTKSGNVYFKINDSWVTGKSLALKINRDGDKLWRAGGGRDVYASVLEKFEEQLIAAVTRDQLDEYQKKVSESLKGIK